MRSAGPVSERRIAVWSAVPAEQELLSADSTGSRRFPTMLRPYAEIVINNLGGNKLDYYLRPRDRICGRRLRGRHQNVDRHRPTQERSSKRPRNFPTTSWALPDCFPTCRWTCLKAPWSTSSAPAGHKWRQVGELAGERRTGPGDFGAERGHPSFEVQVAIATWAVR